MLWLCLRIVSCCVVRLCNAQVEENLKAAGVHLLKDDQALVDIPEVGQVQIIGTEFYFRNPAEKLRATLAQYPRVSGALRLLLLHHPSHFVHIPDGDADLVLSGHHVCCASVMM